MDESYSNILNRLDLHYHFIQVFTLWHVQYSNHHLARVALCGSRSHKLTFQYLIRVLWCVAPKNLQDYTEFA